MGNLEVAARLPRGDSHKKSVGVIVVPFRVKFVVWYLLKSEMTSVRGMVEPFSRVLSRNICEEVNVSQLIWYLFGVRIVRTTPTKQNSGTL